MRRRVRLGDRVLSAEELVAVWQEAEASCPGASHEVRNYAVRRALAEHGYTPLDVFRARYWIRRGKPAGYSWDDDGASVSSRRPLDGEEYDHRRRGL